MPHHTNRDSGLPCSKKEPREAEAAVSAEQAAQTLNAFRKRRDSRSNKGPAFDLSAIYGTVGSDFDFEAVPVDAPPETRLAYLARTVLNGTDAFAAQDKG